MKTKKEIIAEGYAEDWAIECFNCKSFNCHKYEDQIFCFDCKQKIILKIVKTKSPLLPSVARAFTNKLSGNVSGEKRYFPGLK